MTWRAKSANVAHAKAYIGGSISPLGKEYVLGLRAASCETGDLLAEEQATADRKEEVLSALGKAAAKLREKLGESLASVAKYNQPLAEATTSSLEALQQYSEAEEHSGNRGTPRRFPTGKERSNWTRTSQSPTLRWAVITAI